MVGTAAVVVRYQHVIITAKDGRIAVAFVQIVFDIVEVLFVGFQQRTGYSLIVGEFSAVVFTDGKYQRSTLRCGPRSTGCRF